MLFRPSNIVQGARRDPLNSKQAGVSFYKGTGSHPALGPKSQGTHGVGRIYGRIYRLQPRKMRSFIVPPTLHDLQKTLSRPDLRPYTESTLRLPSEVDSSQWPIDRRKLQTKSQKNLAPWHNRDSIYSHKGFDGDYFRQLMQHLRSRNAEKETSQSVPTESK